MNETEMTMIPTIKENTPSMVAVEQSRAVQEVQAAYVIAKKFPRDTNSAYARIIDSCKRLSLASTSMYKYPKGGAVVTGPSIRLAQVLAQNYGNLDFGVVELERRENSSIVESYCIDLETNVRQVKVFEVPHEISLKGGVKKKITDSREKYELVANQAARRLRACILGIIPADITEGAVNQCKLTLAKGSGEPMSDRIRKVLIAFKEIGVSQEMLEKRVGHGVDLITPDEIVDLTAIYTSLKDKQAKRGDFFEFAEDGDVKDAKAAELSALLTKK